MATTTKFTGTTDISAFTSKEISVLSVTDLASFSKNQAAILTSDQMAGFSSATLPAIAGVFKNIPVDSLSGISTAAISGLPLAALTSNQIIALSTGQLPYINVNAIPALHVEWLTSEQWPSITTAEISHLTKTQINAINPVFLTGDGQIETYNNRKAFVLSEAYQAKISATTDIRALTASDFALLSIADLVGMTKSQVESISAEQISALRSTTLPVLNSWGLLSPDVSSQISPDIIEDLPVISLTTTQIAAFSPDQLSALTPAQVATLSKAQISAIPDDYIPALNIAGVDIANIDATKIADLSAEQIGNLSPLQVNALTSTQIAALNQDTKPALQLREIVLNQENLATNVIPVSKVFLGKNTSFNAGNTNLTLFGEAGKETTYITGDVSGIKVDQNIEVVSFEHGSNSYFFKQAGNTLKVYDAINPNNLIASIPIQQDGTDLLFNGQLATFNLSANAVMTATASRVETWTNDLGITHTLNSTHTYDLNRADLANSYIETWTDYDSVKHTASTTYSSVKNTDGSRTETSTSSEDEANSKSISTFNIQGNLIGYTTTQNTNINGVTKQTYIYSNITLADGSRTEINTNNSIITKIEYDKNENVVTYSTTIGIMTTTTPSAEGGKETTDIKIDTTGSQGILDKNTGLTAYTLSNPDTIYTWYLNGANSLFKYTSVSSDRESETIYDAKTHPVSVKSKFSDTNGNYLFERAATYTNDANGNVLTSKSTRTDFYANDIKINSRTSDYKNTYDANGNQLTSQGVSISYDASGVKTGSSTDEYTYDANGNQLTSQAVSISYDASGAQTGSRLDESTHTYYANSNFLTSKITYTNFGANDVKINSDTYEYTYDANGNQLTSQAVSIRYDSSGVQTGSRLDESTYNVNGLSRNEKSTYFDANDVKIGSSTSEFTNTYDSVGRPLTSKQTNTLFDALDHKKGSSTDDGTKTYNSIGNLLTSKQTNTQFDALDHKTGSSTSEYTSTYDSVGNLSGGKQTNTQFDAAGNKIDYKFEPVNINENFITNTIDATKANVNVYFNYYGGKNSYTFNISGFDSGDKLSLRNTYATPTITNTNTSDGIIDVIYDTTTIHLTGLTSAQDSAIFNVLSFNNVFGSGSMLNFFHY